MTINYIRWNVDPEIVKILGYSLTYYALLFIGGIFLCVYILNKVFKNENISAEKLSKLFLYVVIGIIAGARLGHCLFYEPGYYLAHPFEIFLPITSTAEGGYEYSGFHGLASHGSIIGLVIAVMLYSKKSKESAIKMLDLIAIVAPIGGCFIRIANLMNSEIIGIPTKVPWAFVFVRVDNLPRHPAQLYEAISYLIIFGLLFYLYKTNRDKLQNGFFFGLSVTLVFIARFFIELIKEKQVSFEEQMKLDMGQWLSIPFILVGIACIIYGLKKTKNDKLVAVKNTKSGTKTKQNRMSSK
jgi:phosphatidylglycerol---prolipoprotein diacylglyceryl transferase